MLKYLVIWAFFVVLLFSSKLTESHWGKGQTFLEYIKLHNVPDSILEGMSEDDLKFLSELDTNYVVYELKNTENILLQALIPISDQMQIHITKKHKSDEYSFDIIPIEYEKKEFYAKVMVEKDTYADTLKTVHNNDVAKRLSLALKDVADEVKLHKGDEINFMYEQNIRMGKPYLMPDIKVARVKTPQKEQYIYVDEDGDGFTKVDKKISYSVTGKEKVNYTKKVAVSAAETKFKMPLRHVRVTSSFSYRRYHPILKRYRPHHGTDFGAKRGTPLLAVNAGKVSYSGRMGGYGKVVKIRHGGGYESLYAHQSRIRVRRGQTVKRGQVIGYVGSTGRSTGPHLHFGLKKHGRWINPMKVLNKKSIKTTVLKNFTKYENVTKIKYKTVAIVGVKERKEALEHCIKEKKYSHIWND
jgi:murein DD-endopeptidase MepM/ murein hydrolase activator NlpD